MKFHRETRLKDKVKRDKFETKSRAAVRHQRRKDEYDMFRESYDGFPPMNIRQYEDDVVTS